MAALIRHIETLRDNISTQYLQTVSINFSEIDNIVSATHAQKNGLYKSAELTTLFQSFKSTLSNKQFAAFRAWVVLSTLHQSFSSQQPIALPPGLEAETEKNVSRLIEWSEQPEIWDKFVDDVYWKDLAIAGKALIPLRGGVLHLAAGLGFRQALSSNVWSFAAYLILLLRHGKQPYFEIHTHLPLVSDFNQPNWELNYQDISQLLAAHINIKGVFRASWFLDPQLEQISPKLSYLRTFPLQNGAELFYVGKDDSNAAFARSETRKKLFEEGRYTPLTYLLVWPRQSLIDHFK